MVDFKKLRADTPKARPIEPMEIFRRLPKPVGINDLYTSQAEVLNIWHARRNDRDIVVKLHTGGGKTLVGLLMAQSTMNELSGPVLYLTPTVQLVNQTLEKAKSLGISAVPYVRGQPLDEAFVNGTAVMVATYNALFNGKSKFKLRGDSQVRKVAAVILDDAHSAFSSIRDAFTLDVDSKTDNERYRNLANLFRNAFANSNRQGTFDDIMGDRDGSILEVPHWEWLVRMDAVREILKTGAEEYKFVWPLLRDHLHLCHALVSRRGFTITPLLPLVDLFPTFSEAPRRIYMSATIADDSEIVRTFDANIDLVRKPLKSRSLAGISERMILIPNLMRFAFDSRETAAKLLTWTAKDFRFGAVVLSPSDIAAQKWADIGEVALGSVQVEKVVVALQERVTNGPVVFSNRYDGIDLPGDSCRLLVMAGLPAGSSNYELFRAAALDGSESITRMLAQRVEQGIGRGARGAGDYCVVILLGPDLAAWVAKGSNFRFLTTATKAQINIGSNVSEAIENASDIFATVERSFKRESDWVEYHVETLAEMVEEEDADDERYIVADCERKAFNNWRDGNMEKAISRIAKTVDHLKDLDEPTKGWMLQMEARIAQQWGNTELADQLQRNAFGHNRNLTRPKVQPPYRQLTAPGKQATSIAIQISNYRVRNGFMQEFEHRVSFMSAAATANQFEQALAELGDMIGLRAERYDSGGVGPDVLWLMPNNVGLVIEAKSRKLGKNAFTKEQHGQLLVASEWFGKAYPLYQAVRVSVHPTSTATEPAAAEGSFALTDKNLQILIADARALLTQLCESGLKPGDLEAQCEILLQKSKLHADYLVNAYLEPFKTSP